MQRIALSSIALLSLIAGCNTPTRTARPLPSPPTQTRPPPPPPVAMAPRETPPPPPPPPPQQTYAKLNLSDLRPSGGVERGRWRVIVIHHSASSKDTPAGMNQAHLDRGWDRGLGYHFVIGNGVNYPDGKLFVGQRWKGQVTGAHCKASAGRYFGALRPNNYFNDRGVGICLVGNFEETQPTPRQIETCRQLVAWLFSNTSVAPGDMYGHGQVTNKTACPGSNLRARIADLRRSAAQAVAEGQSDFPALADASWLDDDDAALTHEELDGALPPFYAAVERLDIGDGLIFDALDHVADSQRRRAGWTVLGDVEHDQAALPALTGPLGRIGGDLAHANPAPDDRAAAHPVDALRLALREGRFGDERLLPAAHAQRQPLPRLTLADQVEQLRRAADGGLVDARDDVAFVQACRCGRAAGLD